MATNEFIENNYMEALLRAAFLLGDPRQGARVHGITISAYQNCSQTRRLYLRCRINVQGSPHFHPGKANSSVSAGREYLILYPADEASGG